MRHGEDAIEQKIDETLEELGAHGLMAAAVALGCSSGSDSKDAAPTVYSCQDIRICALDYADDTAVMSGAGAGAVVSVCIVSECHRSGRPMRSLVTITGELRSSVASAANKSATSTKPTTPR